MVSHFTPHIPRVVRLVVIAATLASGANAQAQETLSVVLLPTGTSFALTAGSATNPGLLPIATTTSWSLLGLGRTQVALYAYFTSATSALVHSSPSSTIDIPSSRVQASINGGPLAAFTDTVPFGGPAAGRVVFTQAITLLNRIAGVHIDTLTFNINLQGYLLPADTYNGSLRFRAQATP